MAKDSDRKEISREQYREMYHATLKELQELRKAALVRSEGAMGGLDELEHTLRSSVGYWRIGRSSAGSYWVRFKWTGGALEGRYQIGGGSTLLEALSSCLAAIDAVGRGSREAILDKPAPRR